MTSKGISLKPLKVKVLKNNPRAQLPLQATPTAVGFDVFSTTSFRIPGYSKKKAPLGISLEIPHDYYVQISERSGLAVRENIFIKAGVIDPDYRGEVSVVLANHGATPIDIALGEKIAQFVLHHRIDAKFEWTEKLTETERGAGGFGSTDNKN